MNRPMHHEGRIERRITVANKLGLHARAAAKLVKLAGGYQSAIQLVTADQAVDAKSIMGVLLLCGERGAKLTIRAVGADAEVALEALRELVASGFGESE